jgi:D-methionine transport system ATP-binding protein
MIELKNISKYYLSKRQRVVALEDIDFSIARGEIVGILGKSGAGKSTLLRCVNLLERPSAGQVLINGVDLTTLSRDALNQQRRKIAMIFQHFNLLQSRTAFENIALPLELLGTPKADIDKKVQSLLKLVQLEGRGDHTPDQLSGGQKQRVAIARALATDPDILLCDEATSALDPESTTAIIELLKQINQRLNLTILLITHELDVIKRLCHRAGIIDAGRIVEHGRVIDIFSEPKTDVTQQLVKNALHFDIPTNIQQKLKPTQQADTFPIVRLTFVGESSDKPVITALIQTYHVAVNILQANIETIQDTTLGYTLCQLEGDIDATQKAIDYLRSQSIAVEVLGYA